MSAEATGTDRVMRFDPNDIEDLKEKYSLVLLFQADEEFQRELNDSDWETSCFLCRVMLNEDCKYTKNLCMCGEG